MTSTRSSLDRLADKIGTPAEDIDIWANTTFWVVLSNGAEINDLGRCVAYVAIQYAAGTDDEYNAPPAWMSDPRYFTPDADRQLPVGWENDMSGLIAEAEAQFPNVEWSTCREHAGWGNVAVRKGVRR